MFDVRWGCSYITDEYINACALGNEIIKCKMNK